MGDEVIGASSVGKSVRSLLEALASMEREIEFVFERASEGSTDTLKHVAGKLMSGLGRKQERPDLLSLLRGAAGMGDPLMLVKVFARTLGLADETSLESVRGEVRDLIEQVARLREREVAMAGGMSQLRARAARFDDALAGLARVQGRCIARMEGQAGSVREIEQLAGRRDHHITRLIRDTASQRAELEQMSRTVSEAGEQGASSGDNADLGRRFDAFESQFQELKKLHKTGTHGVIETLESLRDRVGSLEARAAEVAREARAKSGRLDALARHVSSVEGRLTSAIGEHGDNVVAVAASMDQADVSLHPVGTT